MENALNLSARRAAVAPSKQIKILRRPTGHEDGKSSQKHLTNQIFAGK
jgi:hypothetical protein